MTSKKGWGELCFGYFFVSECEWDPGWALGAHFLRFLSNFHALGMLFSCFFNGFGPKLIPVPYHFLCVVVSISAVNHAIH